MLLETLAMAGIATLGNYVNKHLDKNPQLNKKLNTLIGADWCDLSELNKKQIIDFVEFEVRLALNSGSSFCDITFEQLDLLQFSIGQKEELYELFSNCNCTWFNKIEIYKDFIRVYPNKQDYILYDKQLVA